MLPFWFAISNRGVCIRVWFTCEAVLVLFFFVELVSGRFLFYLIVVLFLIDVLFLSGCVFVFYVACGGVRGWVFSVWGCTSKTCFVNQKHVLLVENEEDGNMGGGSLWAFCYALQ